MIYSVAHFLAGLVLKFCFFLRVSGRDNYRNLKGGYIVICNHQSNWDPIVIGYGIRKRPVCYMAKEELFRHRLARFFLTRLHAIPIARGAGDIRAVKQALALLADGNILGIFPEGTRSRAHGLQPFGAGAALLALRSGVPVLPCYIKGSLRMFHPASIRFGPPIDLKAIYPGKINSMMVKEATHQLEQHMEELANS